MDERGDVRFLNSVNGDLDRTIPGYYPEVIDSSEEIFNLMTKLGL